MEHENMKHESETKTEFTDQNETHDMRSGMMKRGSQRTGAPCDGADEVLTGLRRVSGGGVWQPCDFCLEQSCSGHGKCDPVAGACMCKDGYSGGFCSGSASCPSGLFDGAGGSNV